MKPNLGWLFYKGYYHNGHTIIDMTVSGDTNARHYRTQNKKILGRSFDETDVKPLPNNHFSHYIRLKTTYPGLMSGTGYAHNVKQEGEFKIGFYFDHTSGLPVLPGSSIKGMLRAAFEDRDYIQQICQEVSGIELSTEQIRKLEAETFDGKNANGKMFSPYERDVFFDAMLSIENKAQKAFLGDDSIAPHEHPLKDPNPLLFLKVLPGVLFDFKFTLHPFPCKPNTDEEQLLSADDKRNIFEKILLDFGIGAKTNVGYGQLVPHTVDGNTVARNLRLRTLEEFEQLLDTFIQQQERSRDKTKDDSTIKYHTGKITPGRTRIDGEYLGEDPTNPVMKRIKLFIDKPGNEQIALLKFPASFENGKKCSVEIGELNKDGTVKTVKNPQWK